MKKNYGTTLLVVGLMFTTIGLTVLDDYKILQYSTSILGLLLSIFSVFVSEKWKKSQRSEGDK